MYQNRKTLYIIGGVAGFLLVAAAILAVTLSFGSESKYDKYFTAAQNAYVTGDFEDALENIEQALGIEQTAECYLLMADIYVSDNNPNMALQVLYLGYSKLGDERLMREIGYLEGEQPDSGDVPIVSGVTIAGSEYPEDTTSLVLANKGLKTSDLHALYQLTELESLSLSGNEIRDIASLADLSTLTFLDLSGNLIEDISPLKSLVSLKTLYIDNNPIADITALHSLQSLRTLSMKGIEISASELEALEKALPECNIFADDAIEEATEITLGGKTFMSDVTELDLSGLDITDISALSQCTKLMKLDLRNNAITDITPLIDCPDLEWLCLWNNKITDLTPLMSHKYLEYLDADQNEVKDITFLRYATAVEELWISGNPIKSIEPIEDLAGLRRLGVKGLELTDENLEMLAGITTLTELRLEDNLQLTMNAVEELKKALPNCAVYYSEGLAYKVTLGSGEFLSSEVSIAASGMGITSLEGLEKFADLQNADLSNNSISDLSPLSRLTALTTLDLSRNNVKDVIDLTGLGNLSVLNLSYNKGVDIYNITSLKNLTELVMAECGIKDISAISPCVRLTRLDLSGNNISDLTPLYDLTELAALDLRGNPALTADDIRELNAALPRCNILTDIDFGEETE